MEGNASTSRVLIRSLQHDSHLGLVEWFSQQDIKKKNFTH